MTPIVEVNGILVKRDSFLPAGFKQRSVDALGDGPHLVASCGNWSSAVLAARPGSVALQSYDYGLVAAHADSVAQQLGLPVAHFLPAGAKSLFLEVVTQLGRWPDAVVFPGSGMSLVASFLAAGWPEDVKLVAACTDSTPNAHNVIYDTGRAERMGSLVPALYCQAGSGVPRYTYPWWTPAHGKRLHAVEVVAEADLGRSPIDLTLYGRLAALAAMRLREQGLISGIILAVETA